MKQKPTSCFLFLTSYFSHLENGCTQAALKENRNKAYEDFEAVAQDLIARGVTSPSKLGCQGGSNGGAKRASTSRLQLVLLKAALLLGVVVKVEEARLEDAGAYRVVVVASGAKSQGSLLGRLGFQLGPKNADGQNCIAVVAHFAFVGEWRTLSDEFNWTYKDAAKKAPEVLRRMQEQYGLYVISPEALEAEGIYVLREVAAQFEERGPIVMMKETHTRWHLALGSGCRPLSPHSIDRAPCCTMHPNAVINDDRVIIITRSI